MTYRIELSSQGGKPYAFFERPSLMEAHSTATYWRKKLGDAVAVTVKESN